MDLGLKGRTAIVCGASSGLGLATAEALAAEGANVTMFARRREVLEREAERIGALAVRGDVTNPRHLAAVVERTVEAFGGLDILVWNSGGLPHLVQSAGGRILIFTSSAVKEPTEHLALSNTVRPGVTGWAKSLARELGPQGVTVNCVAPGRIETARLAQIYPDGPSEADLKAIPLGRWGTPREFGDVACFLASDRARYVTGTTVVVDGGLLRGLL